jgi:hypothetical protein
MTPPGIGISIFLLCYLFGKIILTGYMILKDHESVNSKFRFKLYSYLMSLISVLSLAMCNTIISLMEDGNMF